MSLSRQSIALVLSTKNKGTKHYIVHTGETQRQTEKLRNLPDNLHPGLIRLVRPLARKQIGPYSYNPGARTGPNNVASVGTDLI